MPAPTATINGVVLTEAQIADAQRQIEAAKAAATRDAARRPRVYPDVKALYIPREVAQELGRRSNEGKYVYVCPDGRVGVCGEDCSRGSGYRDWEANS